MTDPWVFCGAADIHLGSPKSYRYDPARNENWATARSQIQAVEPELLLLAGDLTMDGCFHPFELEAVKQDLDALPFPTYVVPGNHDVGNKYTPVQGAWGYDDLEWNVNSAWLRQFATFFGPCPWSFVHKNVRFTGFYAAVTESGLPGEDELWAFLGRLSDLPSPAHHVVMIHYPIYFEHVDEPTYDPTCREEFVPWFFNINQEPRWRILEKLREAQVDWLITGHLHVRRPVEMVEDLAFLRIPAAGGRPQYAERWPDGDATLGFYRFEVTDQRIIPTFVPLEEVSDAQGYGPGGHPPASLRDYSVAWET